MENSQTSPTTPTASTSASGEPVIVLISANTTAQEVLNDQSFLRLWTSWLCRWNLPMSVANRSWIYFLDEELIRNHGEPNEEEVQVTAQFTQKRFNQKGRGGRGRHCGGYNNTTHGTDNNLGGQNSQPNHMQFNRQQQTFYGRGKNLDNVVALTDDSPDSVILPSSALHILPQASLGYPSPDHQVVSTLASHKAALRQSPT
ncbi:hypothetical protein ACOSQ4_028861 [Xanthoceras sorbifolium]